MMLDIADDELVFLARQKLPEAFDCLMQKMAGKIDRMIKKLLSMNRFDGLEYEDLQMIALQTLLLAIDSYQPQKNIFDAYYHFLLHREIVNEMKRFSSPHHQMIITAISLDTTFEEGSSLAEIIGESDASMIHQLNSPIHQLLENDDFHLKPIEKALLSYVQLGYTYSEIGKITGLNYRQVSRMVKTLILSVTGEKKGLYD